MQFLPDEDPITDLLTGQLQLPADFAATQRARVLFGDEIAHFITWSWQDRNFHHGALAVRGKEMKTRLHTDTGMFETAFPCRRLRCRGQLWYSVTSADDLLALHRGAPVRTAASPCSRCNHAAAPG
ncbi:hypothetical protein [Streptomyces spectabilis]|uniref:Uncharacterized protein n=1 Tax=Streptomyces spectabilis TaxID=68270 RepID=A0A7W8B5X4_STRST|nr:hypothetical protein [Streptomyces spectabilis]MBB5109163.1 hypothetical protein [Streptomyces spectabilis]MCI3907723.1 hypothetical protein [Streptomyces spectabilis]